MVALTYLDALGTTMVVRSGAGPITRRLTNVLWRLALKLTPSHRGSRMLAITGGGLLVKTIVVWVLMLWAGWTLIFLAGDATVVDATTRPPASVLDVAYFSGFTVLTLGVGDFVATSGLSQPPRRSPASPGCSSSRCRSRTF